MKKNLIIILFVLVLGLCLSVVASAIDTPWLPIKPDGGSNTEASSPAESDSETNAEINTESEMVTESTCESVIESDTEIEEVSSESGEESSNVDTPDNELDFLPYIIIGCVAAAVVIIIVLRQGKKSNAS